jgi:hypothetical protein
MPGWMSVVGSQITFEVDASGHATKLILHQNELNQVGTLMK